MKRQLLLCVVLGAILVRAQTPPPAQHSAADALRNFDPGQSHPGPQDTLRLLGPGAFPCSTETDPAVLKSCLAAKVEYYTYYAKGLPRRNEVYRWNNLSTRIIFGVVLLLVAIGVYFSWRQFKGAAGTVAVGGESGPEPQVTEFEATFQGIRVRSPVLGVIILTISLAFFYLYLRYVYPVTEAF